MTHHINTVGPPTCVPPRRIPVHLQEEVEHQIRNMLQTGINEESCSSWMALTTYQDDILIYSPSEDTHKKHLREALQRLWQAGLTLRGSKCQIGVALSRLPRHVFYAEGMTPDNGKVQEVQEWPRPRDATEVRQSIGLASYYRKYIQHFADIARPLYRLMQNNTTYHWTEECEQPLGT